MPRYQLRASRASRYRWGNAAEQTPSELGNATDNSPQPGVAKDKPPIGEIAASVQRGGPTLGVRDFREARDKATAEKFQKGLHAFEQEKSLADTRKDIEGFGDTERDLGTRKRARASFESVKQNRKNLRGSMEETRSRAEISDGMRRVTRDEEEVSRIKQDADRPRQAEFEANEDATKKLDDIEARFGSSEVDLKNATKNVEESALKSMHEAHERVMEIQESLDLTEADIQQTEKLLKEWSKGGMFEPEHPVIGGEADKRLPKMQQRSINKGLIALDLIGLGGGLIRDAMSNADKRSKLLRNLSINMRELKDRESQLQDNLKAQKAFFGKRKMIFQALSDEIKRRHRPTRN
jgi:hypothetical protein